MTDTNGLLRAAGGPRKKDDLVFRLKAGAADARAHGWDGDAKDLDAAAAEITRLRAAIARLKLRLAWRDENTGTTHYPECWRDHYACAIFQIEQDELTNSQLMREAQALIAERDTIRKINNGWAAECEKLEEERDALQKNCTTLVEMIELISGIPTMSDEQLAQLVTNCKAAIKEKE